MLGQRLSKIRLKNQCLSQLIFFWAVDHLVLCALELDDLEVHPLFVL